MRLAPVVVLCLAAGCTRVAPDEPADELSGFRGQLIPSASARLAVQGSVGDRPAEVRLELETPLSTVTTGCYESLPLSRQEVRVPTPEGAPLEAPQVKLRRARLGGLRLGTRDAALLEEKRCIVSLGSDVLLPYALQFDPVRREVALTSSRPKARYLAAEGAAHFNEVQLIELTREPRTDWPLLAVRLRQGEAHLTGAFVLSTREANTVVSRETLTAAGFQSGVELSDKVYRMEEVELSPGFGLNQAAVWTDGRWKSGVALGALGADVWSRFHVTFDLSAGVMVLRRPKLQRVGARQLCSDETGKSSEERCFSLHAVPLPEALVAVGTVWRDLPEGGRLYLEPLSAQGTALQTGCRIGLAFAPAGRGVSAQHRFPWPALEEALPDCAKALRGAHGVQLGLFEEGLLEECPGQCAFATDLLSGRTSCECAPHLGGGKAEEQRFYELYRRLLKRHGPEPAPLEEEKEPE